MAPSPRARGSLPGDLTPPAPQNQESRVAELEREVNELREEIARLRTRHLRPDETHAGLGAAWTEQQAIMDEVEHLAHVGTWLWDVKTNEVAWSDELFRIFGIDPALHRPSVELYFQGVHPEDREAVMASSQRSVASGLPQRDARHRVLRPDGSVRHVIVNGTPIRDSENQLIRIVGAVLDVTQFVHVETELRRTAEFLTEAQRIAKLGSFTWYAADNRIDWSETLFGIFAFEPDSRGSRRQFIERVHPDDRQRVEQSRKQLFSGTPTQPFEYRLMLPDGSLRYVHTDARVELDPQGKVVRALATIQDVTERKELEEQLRHSQKMEAIGTLAGGVAHDFNNYLVVIQGNLELLRSNARTAAEHELLDDIERAAGRCETLTRQLLTFSRKQAAAPRHVDLNAIVKDSSRLLGRLLGEHIELAIQVEPEPASVYADPAHLEQVIMNLAINARDAMPTGGLLSIEVERRESADGPLDKMEESKDRGYVLLRVSDTGSGIPKELRERVFEPFFTTKEPGRGTGLGLATVYGIVQQCGGHIEFQNRAGTGTSFEVYLPLSRGVPQTGVRSTRPPLAEGTEFILLVEDEPQVRRLTRLLLERGGYRVVEAENGEVALALAGQLSGIDLVLSDVSMPRMNGVELARQLKSRFPQLRVVLMSGYPDNSGGDVSKDEALRNMLHKPFTPEKLLTRVRKALDERDKTHESRK